MHAGKAGFSLRVSIHPDGMGGCRARLSRRTGSRRKSARKTETRSGRRWLSSSQLRNNLMLGDVRGLKRKPCFWKRWRLRNDRNSCSHPRRVAYRRRERDERLRGERKHDKYRTRKAPTEQRRRLTSSPLTRYIRTIRRLVSGSRTADDAPPGDSPKLCGTGHWN